MSNQRWIPLAVARKCSLSLYLAIRGSATPPFTALPFWFVAEEPSIIEWALKSPVTSAGQGCQFVHSRIRSSLRLKLGNTEPRGEIYPDY